MKANIIILGPIGSGKSHAKRTLLAEYPDAKGKIQKGAGLTVLDLSCEPGWEATNGDLTCEMGYHVCQVLPANPDWKTALRWLEIIEGMDTEAVLKKPVSAPIMKEYSQFMDLYRVAIEFKCIRCEKNFGCADDWDEDIAFTNDGLTGISKMAVHFAVGPKPAMTWPEFNRTQKHVEDYIDKCCALRCSYILIAHWAREPDPVEGGSNITVHTIGRALAPRLLLDTFDEVILAVRDVDKYTWNLNDRRVDQKARRLEYKSGLEPNFSQIFRNE